MESLILKTLPQDDYELLDSGEGEKLERFGGVVLRRPDPQALWRKNLPEEEWVKAVATFIQKEKGSSWKKKKDTLAEWQVSLGGLNFLIKLASFKHVGIFPEQLSNWEWIEENVKNQSGIRSDLKNSKGQILRSGPVKILNLFGYTGGATLAAARAGAEVCHVDGSKVAIASARKNAELSGLADKPIRWILDDTVAFVKREIKRGKKYDGIIMDPPAFGHGAGGEVWKIEENFLPFVEECAKLLSDKPLFFLINGYASGYSPLAYKNILEGILAGKNGVIETGELTIKESKSDRLLPAGIFARWSNGQ